MAGNPGILHTPHPAQGNMSPDFPLHKGPLYITSYCREFNFAKVVLWLTADCKMNKLAIALFHALLVFFFSPKSSDGQGLRPQPINIAQGKKIEATATCGEDVSEPGLFSVQTGHCTREAGHSRVVLRSLRTRYVYQGSFDQICHRWNGEMVAISSAVPRPTVPKSKFHDWSGTGRISPYAWFTRSFFVLGVAVSSNAYRCTAMWLFGEINQGVSPLSSTLWFVVSAENYEPNYCKKKLYCGLESSFSKPAEISVEWIQSIETRVWGEHFSHRGIKKPSVNKSHLCVRQIVYASCNILHLFTLQFPYIANHKSRCIYFTSCTHLSRKFKILIENLMFNLHRSRSRETKDVKK